MFLKTNLGYLSQIALKKHAITNTYCSELLWQLTDPETYWKCSGLDNVVDFGKRNCNISLSQKPIIWFPELVFKFITLSCE